MTGDPLERERGGFVLEKGVKDLKKPWGEEPRMKQA